MRPLLSAPRQVVNTPPPVVTAKYVAVLDEQSGALLYGQGEHERAAPASITKIATATVALERSSGQIDRIVESSVSGSAMAAHGSSIMGLEPGTKVTLQTLLYGLMLPSGNDAAEQLALTIGGTRERFIQWMNDRVGALALANTRFVNPHGLDNRSHYSSAWDMAVLGREAMRDETFRAVARAATYRGDGYALTNLNRLIGRYAGADGIKIGSTPGAGKTIVASATRGGRRVYVSLLRSTDLLGDASALLDWVWGAFSLG